MLPPEQALTGHWMALVPIERCFLALVGLAPFRRRKLSLFAPTIGRCAILHKMLVEMIKYVCVMVFYVFYLGKGIQISS